MTAPNRPVLVLAGALDAGVLAWLPAGVDATLERVASVLARSHVAADAQVPAAVLIARFADADAARRAFAALPASGDAPLDAYLTTEITIFERPSAAPTRRRLSLLRRRSEFCAASFAHYWRHVHAPFAAAHQGVARYAQYPVRAHRVLGGAGVACDGIGEFLVTDAAAMDRGYASAAGRRMTDDASRFLAASTTFYLDPMATERSAA